MVNDRFPRAHGFNKLSVTTIKDATDLSCNGCVTLRGPATTQVSLERLNI